MVVVSFFLLPLFIWLLQVLFVAPGVSCSGAYRILVTWPFPVVTREYTSRACRNSRKPMRLHPRHEMRPDSPALHAEELRFPNPTHKDPRFACLNSRESPTRLSQDEKNTDVTSGMQNWLVYPKSTQDAAHFPFNVSIAVSHSTSYTTSVLTSFTTIQRFTETPISSL